MLPQLARPCAILVLLLALLPWAPAGEATADAEALRDARQLVEMLHAAEQVISVLPPSPAES